MKARKFLPPVLLGLGLLAIYLATLAPGLTWANDGTDGGDLITAAATGGVAHPSGYPTYLLLASAFQALPLGTLAFRTNLLSAVLAALSSVFVYGIVTDLSDSPAHGNRPAGLLAGLTFGLSPLVWSQAVITEVYTLHAFFCALLIYLAGGAGARLKNSRWDLGAGIISGLALGNHLTALFLLPPLFLNRILTPIKKFDWKVLGRMLAGLTAGLLVYIALPLRALTSPPVNWGNPVTLRQFTWLVSGELYQRRLAELSLAGITERFPDYLEILLRQVELPGILLALIGLIYYFKPTRLTFITLWNFVIFSVFSILYVSFDSYLYLIPAVLSITIWAGFGLGGLMEQFAKNFRWLKYVLVVLICIFIAGMALVRWPQLDASGDRRAEQFGAEMMQTIPPNALVFAEEDWDIFTLWYYHFALEQRPDMVVMATDLLHFEWYDQTLRATYPDIYWPDGLFWQQTVAAANPARPVCIVSWTADIPINCSPAP